ncbi:hypothetical protein KUV80_13000 [Fictibacillus nanhaiensis]|uniref:sugar phosphate nucleotidyltransferase n=1 Tax=Fictibacillus nanhaiensis TaxID=742169 RepID=UPI001C97E9B6|nr:sugar phosphate nucleotidyltransferase [Fictibacillus nanhaiensis]MBY6037581.1 hypothetical protein [Fictibacillus nanhaiensis]
MKVFGVIPAAGKGSRLSPLPFSKELFPLGFMNAHGKICPKPVSAYLIEALKKAGIDDLYWITSVAKTDIQKYYKSGTNLKMNFCYLLQEEPNGLVDALTCIDPWINKMDEYLIALGLPDTLFYPPCIFTQMKKRLLDDLTLDVVLGLFKTDQWYKLGMVEYEELEEKSLVKRIVDKPKEKPNTEFAWGVAMWKPSFQSRLAKFLSESERLTEYTLSEAFNSAIGEGLNIGIIKGSHFIDMGTVEDLQKAIEIQNSLSFEENKDD